VGLTKAWIGALRLRTLPLSLSGIIVGSAMAYYYGGWNFQIFILAISTTVLFQILSNLANDLGDSQKGTDNDQRVGPTRAIQSGEISQRSMKNAVVLVTILSFASACVLIYISSALISDSLIWIYLGLTGVSIFAAILYTVGKSAYGYYGLGDLMVFLFFGCLSVLGVFILYGMRFEALTLMPAFTIGFWSVAVLNLNNMRDIVNDAASSKRTVVVQLGSARAKYYHLILILSGLSIWTTLNGVYVYLNNNWIFLIAVFPTLFLYPHLKRVIEINDPSMYDPELKKVALITFSSSILFATSLFLV
jgi:1,4-dihydroxy-2-naphthoate octaprenyltransferase